MQRIFRQYLNPKPLISRDIVVAATGSRRNKSSQREHEVKKGARLIRDHYSQSAKTEAYQARSAYKLKEIQQKYRVVQPGGSVLDLGCHPGAWLQVASQGIGHIDNGGLVLGIDLKHTDVPQSYCDERVVVLQGDARDFGDRLLLRMQPGGFHTVLSDMCHNTQGIMDAEKQLELAVVAAQIACGADYMYDSAMIRQGLTSELKDHRAKWSKGVLRMGGNFVTKLFCSQYAAWYVSRLRLQFNTVKCLKPKSTRQESKEQFVIALGRKPQEELNMDVFYKDEDLKHDEH